MSDAGLSHRPESLPANPRARRLAITALTNRAVAESQEQRLRKIAGQDGEAVINEWITANTSEMAAQLLLTEQLLSKGWSWDAILRSVWYRDEALREAALRD